MLCLLLSHLIWSTRSVISGASLFCLDLQHLSLVHHGESTLYEPFSISEPKVLLLLVSDAAFTLKMMRWHQPTGPPAINYWHGKIECGPHHSFYLYNDSYIWRWNFDLAVYCDAHCSAYCTVYCTVFCTVYCTVCCAVYYSVYCTVYYSAFYTVYSILQPFAVGPYNKRSRVLGSINTVCINRCFLHIIQAAESYESLCYFVLGSIADTQFILYSRFLAFCFSLSLFAYFLSNVKTAASLPNTQDITTLRLKEKAAGQSACFDPAKAISSSWESITASITELPTL